MPFFRKKRKRFWGYRRKASEKIVIIVKDGMVDSVYISKELHEVVVKIIDMDATEPISERTALFRKKRVKNQLIKIY